MTSWIFAPGSSTSASRSAPRLPLPVGSRADVSGFALPLPCLAPARPDSRGGLALDVVHAQHPFLLGVTARRLARRLGRPLVFTYHTRYEKYAHYVPLPERRGGRAGGSPRLPVRELGGPGVAPSEHMAATLAAARGPGACRRGADRRVPLDVFRPGDRRAGAPDARAARGRPDLSLRGAARPREERGARDRRVRRHRRRAVSGSRLLLVGPGHATRRGAPPAGQGEPGGRADPLRTAA